MPTRYLKPGICDSDRIDKCSPLAECLFYRLLVNVDDFGRLDARPAIIKSKCFPLKDDFSNSKAQELLIELDRLGLILLYEVGGATFLQICKWDNVPRAQTSKFPAPHNMQHPKEMLEIISEDDLEIMICDSIKNIGEFAGLSVISHERQVRKEQSYFDIVLGTNLGQIGIELKRTRISNSAVAQTIRYSKLSGIPFILIGAGIGVGVDISECEKNGITVAIYDENFNARVISRDSVISREFTLRAVAPLTVTETKTKTKTKPSSATGVAGYSTSFLTFWGMYPNRKNKGAAFKAFKKIHPDEYPAVKDGLLKAIDSSDWKKNNGQFIPHPATWINARGWESEYKDHASDSMGKPWFITASGIEAKAVELKLIIGKDEQIPQFLNRVKRHAGITAEMERIARIDSENSLK